MKKKDNYTETFELIYQGRWRAHDTVYESVTVLIETL